MAKNRKAPADEPEQEPLRGFLQIYRIKINNIDYLLFGPPITPDEDFPTLVLQEFKAGEILPTETVLRSIRLVMDPAIRGELVKRLQ